MNFIDDKPDLFDILRREPWMVDTREFILRGKHTEAAILLMQHTTYSVLEINTYLQPMIRWYLAHPLHRLNMGSPFTESTRCMVGLAKLIAF